MASILDFLITSKASVLFTKVSENTGETREGISTAIGAVLPLLLGAMQHKINTEKGAKKLYFALDNEKFSKEFLTDINKLDFSTYSSFGKEFLPQIIDSENTIKQNLSGILGIKNESVALILEIAVGIIMHIISIQKTKEKLQESDLKELIRSQMGASSKFNHSLISTILDKNEEGNIIQDVEGRIIGGGQNNTDKDGGVLGGMLGGK